MQGAHTQMWNEAFTSLIPQIQKQLRWETRILLGPMKVKSTQFSANLAFQNFEKYRRLLLEITSSGIVNWSWKNEWAELPEPPVHSLVMVEPPAARKIVNIDF